MTAPVTVVLPLYDEPPDRREVALTSAIAARPAEIIVVDDGSPSPVEVAGEGVRLIRTEHRGLAAALNTGIDEASQPYVQWLSAGDTIHANKLTLQSDRMAANDWRACIAVVQVDSFVMPRFSWRRRLWTTMSISMIGALIETALLREIRYDETLTWAVDWRMALEIHRRGLWQYMPMVLAAGTANHGHSDRGGPSPIRAENFDRVKSWAQEIQCTNV